MIKSQRTKIIAFAIAAVVLIVAYFAIVLPLVNRMTDESEEPPTLVEGEVLGSNNRILLFEHTEKANIQSIEVHNDSGTWTMYRGDDNEFYLKGYEGAPYSKTLLASLVSDAGYTLSMTRVTDNCTDWSVYGLDEASSPAWYVLTTLQGETHTVYIGDKIPTGAGYYVRYKDRPCVYVLQSSLASTLLASLEDMVTPILTYPLGTTDYYMVENFYLADHDVVKLAVTYLDEEQRAKLAQDSPYLMVYPANYTVSSTYETLLQTFMNFIADRTILQGSSTEAISQEDLAKYGLDNPAYEIYFEYNDIANCVIFSEKTENDTYYVYSFVFNLIGEVSASSVSFLEYDLIQYIDRPVFQRNINDIGEIKIESDQVSETFTLVGEGEELVVTQADGSKLVVQNFRQFYKTLLSIQIEDYVPEGTDPANLKCMATFTATTRAGAVFEYKFYQYTTRRALITINGEGEFYCIVDDVHKMLNDTERILKGETVDADAKN